MTLSFTQIYYDESQKGELYNFAKPYFNDGLTPYFENSIIADIVPSIDADLIGVASWRLRQKRMNSQIYLKNDLSLTEEKITNSDFDVAILTPHSPSHKCLAMSANWHGKAWVDAFNAFKPFLKQFGKVPDELKYAIYENHFITRKEIYHDYINRYLIPAIAHIGGSPVYFADSGYIAKKRGASDIERVQRLLGRRDWPIVPFLLERLFSFYIDSRNFKVINL
jgi:hypothetical protein